MVRGLCPENFVVLGEASSVHQLHSCFDTSPRPSTFVASNSARPSSRPFCTVRRVAAQALVLPSRTGLHLPRGGARRRIAGAATFSCGDVKSLSKECEALSACSDSPRPNSSDAEQRRAGEGERDQQELEWRIPSNADIIARAGASAVGPTLGVDYGGRRIGLAVSRGGFAPSPLKVLDIHPKQKSRTQVAALRVLQVALDQGADEIVVGLPTSWDNSEGDQAEGSRRFALALAKVAAEQDPPIRAVLQDEYLSTKAAMDLMIASGVGKKARQERLDSYAAVVILSDYFARTIPAEIVLPEAKKLKSRLVRHFRMRFFPHLGKDAAAPICSSRDAASCTNNSRLQSTKVLQQADSTDDVLALMMEEEPF